MRGLVAIVMFGVLAQGAAWAGAVEFTPPDEKARCPVCGMFVAPYPTWLAAVVLDGQATIYFDGPKDMFNYLTARADYHRGETLPEIDAVFVSEYYTQQRLKAEEVFFVSGSDVHGPMGNELVPIAGRQALESFLQDHGGDKVQVYLDGQLTESTSP